MKKCMFKGMALLTMGFAFVACSHETVYDENHAEKERTFDYDQAFAKEFGTIAKGHKWGFDQTTGHSFTRASYDKTHEVWIIPENFTHGRRTKEGNAANAVQAAFNTNLSQTLNMDFKNYWLQHVDMPKNVKVDIVCLEAYNSNTKAWEAVKNFDAGKNETDFQIEKEYDVEITAESQNFLAEMNTSAACTTLMTDMGGEGDPQNGNKIFRVKMKEKKGKTTSYYYNYDYYFLPNFSYHKNDAQSIYGDFLGFYFTSPQNGKTGFWVIKIAAAEKYTPTTPNPVAAEGRVLCEDMGANDFDFNDVVFDAWIMKTGEIKIKVLAHGGKLPIAIDGVNVTLGQMTNTGVNTADYQEFTIAAVDGKAKYASIDAIPVTVNPNGAADNTYNLEAKVGSAPQKICVPIGTDYPDEYVKISEAYTPFTEWVSILSPSDWTYTVNAILVDGILSNNE